MRTYLIISLVFIIGCAFCQLDATKPYVTREFVEKYKNESTFDTYDYEDHPFKDLTLDQLKAHFNTPLASDTDKSLRKQPIVFGDLKALPNDFDTRKKWPNCQVKLKNQQNCGACWAFAATSTLADRFCIQSDGKWKVDLSPQDMVSCDIGAGDNGCTGGLPLPSWNYLRYRGVVSEGCMPYVSGGGYVPYCPMYSLECADRTPYRKFYAKSYYRFQTVEEYMYDMMAKGPIQTGFQVYEDFTNYRGGIYVRRSSQRIGGHMVKIVGWGTYTDFYYWIVQNSYGSSWGENGFFRIKMGECEFESELLTGDPLFQ